MSQIIFRTEFSSGSYQTFDGIPDLNFKKVHQVHGNKIIRITDASEATSEVQADGLLQLSSVNVPLAIVTADCLPVLILGENGRCMIHAGWKGLASGILKNIDINSIGPRQAYIGPCIRAQSYEVDKDFGAHFPGSRHFFKSGVKYYFDLIGEAKDQLRETYPAITISESGICTLQDHRFHSFRRDKTSKRNYHIFIPAS